EPFDGRDRAPVRLDGEHRARLDRLAVEQDRARAARRGVAADVRARQPELLAEEVDEELPRLDLRLVQRAVDRDPDGPQWASIRLNRRPTARSSALRPSLRPATGAWAGGAASGAAESCACRHSANRRV